MQAIDLSRVVPGFNHPVEGSQQIFRNALQALSHPGEIIPLTIHAEIPKQTQPSAAVLLLALLDADSRLWVSPAIAASDATHWIMFHTNCTLVNDPAEADFAWIESMEAFIDFSRFNPGTDEYPEISTTCLINIPLLDSSANEPMSISLQGPGIAETHQMTLGNIAPDQIQKFVTQWHLNTQLFPKGVDVFLCAPGHMTGLPRTTQLSLAGSSSSIKA